MRTNSNCSLTLDLLAGASREFCLLLKHWHLLTVLLLAVQLNCWQNLYIVLVIMPCKYMHLIWSSTQYNPIALRFLAIKCYRIAPDLAACERFSSINPLICIRRCKLKVSYNYDTDTVHSIRSDGLRDEMRVRGGISRGESIADEVAVDRMDEIPVIRNLCHRTQSTIEL